jgi:hypothetical protein
MAASDRSAAIAAARSRDERAAASRRRTIPALLGNEAATLTASSGVANSRTATGQGAAGRLCGKAAHPPAARQSKPAALIFMPLLMALSRPRANAQASGIG